jgi:hypothetical protein
MGLTNYPNGISSFGVPQIGGSTLPVTDGNYFFVDASFGSNGNEGNTPEKPFATVAYAISVSTAGNNDVIVMLPAHTETIATAGGWTPKAGTFILGLGWGDNRPRITMSATASTILLSAAGVSLRNFRVTTSVAEVVTIISMSGAGCTIDAVDYYESGTFACITFLTTTAAANRFSLLNCRHASTTAPTGTAGWLSLVGGDAWRIENNTFIVARAATSWVCRVLTTAATNIFVQNNTFCSTVSDTATVAFVLLANTTGHVAFNNGINIGKTAIAGSLALASCTGTMNYASKAANKNGLLDPVVDS